MRITIDREARRAAVALLRRGLVRPHEVAELSGVSLQVVNYWCRAARIDWKRVRKQRLAKWWRKEITRGEAVCRPIAQTSEEEPLGVRS